MIIKIHSIKLLNMLRIISSCVQKNKKTHILSNILIKTLKHSIFCIAINEELEIITHDTLDTLDFDGELIINYELIYNICKNSKEQSIVTIKILNNSLEIQSENSVFNLPCINDQIFPSFKKNTHILTHFKLKTDNIKNLFSKSHISISENNPRAFLNGIFLEINKNSLTTLSSDGSRLLFNQILNDYDNDIVKIILPKSSINALMTTFENYTYTYITVSNTFIKFTTNNIIITSKLINDTYHTPNIKISSNLNIPIIIKKNDIKDAISKINILCTNDSRLNFQIKKDTLTIKIKNKTDYANATIKINNNHTDAHLGLNYKHLTDIIKNINEDNFEFIITKSEENIIIKEKDSNYLYFITPFKL